MKIRVAAVEDSNEVGYWFWCPGCDRAHRVTNLWEVDLIGLTIRPSIHVSGGSKDIVCHSFVTEGKIQFLDDSTHHLAGQTVEIPDWRSR